MTRNEQKCADFVQKFTKMNTFCHPFRGAFCIAYWVLSIANKGWLMSKIK